MNNRMSMKIAKPASEAFEAFVDPAKIGKFWFSSSSDRWEPGRTITLKYDEYDAQVNIRILEIEKDKRIVFRWGDDDQGNLVTIKLLETDGGQGRTVVEVVEDGFDEKDDQFIAKLLDNKEGWVYALTCLKAYLEFGIANLRAGV